MAITNRCYPFSETLVVQRYQIVAIVDCLQFSSRLWSGKAFDRDDRASREHEDCGDGGKKKKHVTGTSNFALWSCFHFLATQLGDKLNCPHKIDFVRFFTLSTAGPLL